MVLFGHQRASSDLDTRDYSQLYKVIIMDDAQYDDYDRHLTIFLIGQK